MTNNTATRQLLKMSRRNLKRLLGRIGGRIEKWAGLKENSLLDPALMTSTLNDDSSVVVIISSTGPQEPPPEPDGTKPTTTLTLAATTIVATMEYTALDPSLLAQETVLDMSDDAKFEELMRADVGILMGLELNALVRADQRLAKDRGIDALVQRARRLAARVRNSGMNVPNWAFRRPKTLNTVTRVVLAEGFIQSRTVG